jgi:predicted MFS family arabinose efflux permease
MTTPPSTTPEEVAAGAPTTGQFPTPAFRWFFGARTLSMFGDHMYAVGLAFAVLKVSPTPGALGAVLMAGLLPKIVITPLAGAWCDRLDRRWVLATGDVVAAVVTAITVIALATDSASVSLLIVLAILLGSATSFFDPAAVGLIAEIVDRPHRRQANASLGVAGSAARIVGPALAGVIVAWLGPAAVVAANSASFLLSAVCITMIRAAAAPPTSAPVSTLRAVWEGWREFGRLTWLWLLTIQSAVYVFCGLAIFNVVGPLAAQDRWGGAAAWGTIQAGLGVGFLVGRLVSARYQPARPALAAALVILLTIPSAVSLAFSPVPLVVAFTQVFAGAGLAINATIIGTLFTQLVPSDRISRIVATDQVLTLAAMPLAYALVGVVAPAIGFAASLVGGAVVIIATTALLTVHPAIRAIREGPTGALHAS